MVISEWHGVSAVSEWHGVSAAHMVQQVAAPRLSSLYGKPRIQPVNSTGDSRMEHRIRELSGDCVVVVAVLILLLADLRGPLPSQTRLRALIELKQLRLGKLQKQLRGEVTAAEHEIQPKVTYLRKASPKVAACIVCREYSDSSPEG